MDEYNKAWNLFTKIERECSLHKDAFMRYKKELNNSSSDEHKKMVRDLFAVVHNHGVIKLKITESDDGEIVFDCKDLLFKKYHFGNSYSYPYTTLYILANHKDISNVIHINVSASVKYNEGINGEWEYTIEAFILKEDYMEREGKAFKYEEFIDVQLIKLTN